MMTHETILYSTDGHVATIRLNRPERLNAWNAEMESAFREALVTAESDTEVRAIVVRGEGKAFCAGADLARTDQGPIGIIPQRFAYIQSIEKPIVAAVDGAAVGIGFVLAILCDIRLASRRAKIGAVFPRRGLVAEHGVAWLLPRMIGSAKAADLLLSGRIVDAGEALSMGLVSQVFEEEDFVGSVDSYCRNLANACAPLATVTIKRQIRMGWGQDLVSAISLADFELDRSKRTNDYKEGIAHFLEKRPAQFSGC